MEVNQEDDSGDFYEDGIEYLDDRTGLPLDAKLVAAAEREELDFMEEIGVDDECDERECWERTGKTPTSSKFVRVNKGSRQHPDIRARLCARDFKLKGEGDREDLFAAMPPLEAKKLLFRQAVREPDVWRGGGFKSRKLLLIDVKKAHLNGIVPEEGFSYVRLPNRKMLEVCTG